MSKVDALFQPVLDAVEKQKAQLEKEVVSLKAEIEVLKKVKEKAVADKELTISSDLQEKVLAVEKREQAVIKAEKEMVKMEEESKVLAGRFDQYKHDKAALETERKDFEKVKQSTLEAQKLAELTKAQYQVRLDELAKPSRPTNDTDPRAERVKAVSAPKPKTEKPKES